MKKFFFWLCPFICTFSFANKIQHQQVIHALGLVAADDENRVSVAWPGSGFELVAAHHHIQLMFLQENAAWGENFLGLELNGKWVGKIKLKTDHNKVDLHNFVNFKKGDTLRIIKLTESSVGLVILELSKHQQFNPQPLNSRKIIQFIGDSFTCGYGNEASIEAPPKGNPNTGFHTENQNNYFAWGAMASRALKMDYLCTSFSGKGLIRNNDGNAQGTMPALWKMVLAQHSYKTYKPNADIYVIHLGTNDFFQGVPDSSQFVRVLVRLAEDCLQNDDQSRVVLCVSNGLTDSWPLGENRRTHHFSYVKSAFDLLNKTHNANRVLFLDLPVQSPPYGEDWHPSLKTHREMAEMLVDLLKQNQ